MMTVLDPRTDCEPDDMQLAELWWVVALRGAVAVALGLMALIWPNATLLTFVIVFAAYCIMEGLYSILLAVRGARYRRRWHWSALFAIVSLASGAFAVLYPGVTLFGFVILLTAWALLNGAFSIAAGFRLEKGYGRTWLIASGVASLLLAMLLLAWPPVGLFTLTWMFAFYAILAGVSTLGLALRLRSGHSLSANKSAGVSETQSAK